jgi:Protein of unknown function (DUF2934)
METRPSDRVHEGHADVRRPLHEEIARRAYKLWEQRGRPNGSREEDWFRAESELSHPSEVLPADTAAAKDFCEFSQR